jgi:hypothetical protein
LHGIIPRLKVPLILFFCLLPAFVFGRAKADEPEQAVQKNEWILCITNFDMSALPPNHRITGEVMTRNLVNAVNALGYRIRISREYAYYEGYAWSQARTAAAKALSAKRDERDLLLYRGEPAWRYRRSLKTIEGDIKKLEEALAKTEAEMPLIEQKPVFKFTDGNASGNFPEAPEPGGEYRFCQSQKADGFLAGELIELYGRLYITLRLYAVYTRSVIYEDNIIFSPDDAGDAVDEIAGRLVAVLGGSRPAAIAVRAEPEDTLVLINKTFAGRGEIAPREHPPGKVTISLSAENHAPQTVETELFAGELTEIETILVPLNFAPLEITIPGETGVLVYQGALYVGEAPLTLRLPLNQLDYVHVETPSLKTAQAVFMTPGLNETGTLSLNPKIPPPLGQKRVEKARRQYYWAWGTTWIAAAAAWMISGSTTSYGDTYRNTPLSVDLSPDLYNQAMTFYYINIGALTLLGAAVTYDIFQLVRYIYISGQDAAPIIKR